MNTLLSASIFSLVITFVIMIVFWDFWKDNKRFPKWPSLILLLLGVFSFFFMLYAFIQILNPESPMNGMFHKDCSFIGLLIYCFFLIMISFFLLAYLLRKTSFRDFFKKEFYRKNVKKIFVGFITITITYFLIIYMVFILDPLGPIIEKLCFLEFRI